MKDTYQKPILRIYNYSFRKWRVEIFTKVHRPKPKGWFGSSYEMIVEEEEDWFPLTLRGNTYYEKTSGGSGIVPGLAYFNTEKDAKEFCEWYLSDNKITIV